MHYHLCNLSRSNQVYKCLSFGGVCLGTDGYRWNEEFIRDLPPGIQQWFAYDVRHDPLSGYEVPLGDNWMRSWHGEDIPEDWTFEDVADYRDGVLKRRGDICPIEMTWA